VAAGTRQGHTPSGARAAAEAEGGLTSKPPPAVARTAAGTVPNESAPPQ
jgi:hypothetical protein